MSDIKKIIFFIIGWCCLILAYIGIVTPGIPFSIFLVGAAYFFARSSKKMEDWIYNHKVFGPFLINWENKRIFPKKAKYMMILVMSSSLLFLWLTTENIKAVAWSGGFMFLVACWAWRFPGSLDEYFDRKGKGEKIGWTR